MNTTHITSLVRQSKLFTFALCGVVLAVAAGCSTTKPADASSTAASAPAVSAPAAPAAQSAVAKVDVSPLDDPKSPLAKRSVFFDFDGFQIHSADMALIEAHAKYLTTHKSAHVRLEGNADERGGTEYNLALGQKRAESVRKAMLVLGVQDGAVEAISYGKEKPMEKGHTEEAWAKNRRVDISYVSR